MVVQHFSPEGFSRKRDWARQAHEIMDKLKLDYKKVSTFEFTNPPIIPGEVYIGKKALAKGAKNQKFKLFYIPPELLYEPEVSNDYLWGAFVPIKTHAASPYRHIEWKNMLVSPTAHTTRMSIPLRGMDINWIRENTSYIKEKIERSYPEYISLTELKILLRPIRFMNWMKEKPLSLNKETEIIEERAPPSPGRIPPHHEMTWDDIWKSYNK